MTDSMTGFARCTQPCDWGTFVIEARSVNHRHLELSPRLPAALRPLESALRERVGQYLARGKIDFSVRLEPSAARQNIELDSARLTAVTAAVTRIQAKGIDCRAPDALALLDYPGVQRVAEPDVAAVRDDFLAGVDAVLAELCARRAEEGQRLAETVRARGQAVRRYAQAVAARLPAVRDAWHARLTERLERAGVAADPARVEQELVIAAQKMDVAEEIDRLIGHVDAVTDALADTTAIGRRLDFLMQEMNREANTIGSKSIDAEITAHVVEMKVLIDQMREQIQNIE